MTKMFVAVVGCALVVSGCASTRWLIVPDARLAPTTSVHVVVSTGAGESHDLGAGEWSTTGVGIAVLRVPAVERGALRAELSDGSSIDVAFDEGDYDVDRNGIPDRDDARFADSGDETRADGERRRQREWSEENRRQRDDETSDRMVGDDD